VNELFVSQRYGGINPHRSPRWNVAPESGDAAQQNRDVPKRPMVSRPHTVEQALQVTRNASRRAEAHYNARQR